MRFRLDSDEAPVQAPTVDDSARRSDGIRPTLVIVDDEALRAAVDMVREIASAFDGVHLQPELDVDTRAALERVHRQLSGLASYALQAADEVARALGETRLQRDMGAFKDDPRQVFINSDVELMLREVRSWEERESQIVKAARYPRRMAALNCTEINLQLYPAPLIGHSNVPVAVRLDEVVQMAPARALVTRGARRVFAAARRRRPLRARPGGGARGVLRA